MLLWSKRPVMRGGGGGGGGGGGVEWEGWVMGSGRGSGRSGGVYGCLFAVSGDLLGEGDRVDSPAVWNCTNRRYAPRSWSSASKVIAPCAVLAVGVHVRVREVGGVQGDQVPVGAEVGLEVGHGPPATGHAEGQLGFLGGPRVRPAAGARPRSRRRTPAGSGAGGWACASRHDHRGADHVLAAVDHEVGDRAVAAGRGVATSTDQVPSEFRRGCRCW